MHMREQSTDRQFVCQTTMYTESPYTNANNTAAIVNGVSSLVELGCVPRCPQPLSCNDCEVAQMRRSLVDDRNPTSIGDVMKATEPPMIVISTDHPCEPCRNTFDTSNRTPLRFGGCLDRPVTFPSAPHGWSVSIRNTRRTRSANEIQRISCEQAWHNHKEPNLRDQ